jgi:hypothetical protein
MKTPKVQPTVQVGNIEKISGEVNIAAGNIIKRSNTIYERALTVAEEAKKARLLEGKLLAEGVGLYIQQLQERAKNKRMTGIPYKGLLEYRLEEAESFHGRKQATQSLLETLEGGPFAVLHAESGAGKTSLIRAGIAPRILAHGHLPLYLRPYDKSPSLAIKQAFLLDLNQAPILAKASLRDFLCQVVKILGKKTVLYIMLDQFEEFFLRVDEKEQAAFINELGECIDDNTLNVQWLISLRSEYFGRLANFRPRIHNPYENDFLLNRLTRDEAREAIILPARKHKIEFESELVDQILDDLGGEKIVPPQLQLVCSALYETLSLNGKKLTKEIYQVQEGGADGILRGHLERVLKRLPPDERIAARQILEALITSVQQRTLRPRGELIQSLSARGLNSSALQSAIDQLVDSRLLRVEESDAGPAYELAHDYLLDEIKLDSKVINRKQAEELIEQGVSNWRKHHFLLAPDVQKVIEAQREELVIASEAATLLFLSAIEYKRPAQKWVSYISEEERKKLITSYMQGKQNQKTSEALWSLRSDLEPQLRMKVSVIRFISVLLSFLLKTALLLTAIALVIFILVEGINSTFQFVDWSTVNNFSSQCLDGNKPSRPLVAIDASNDSRIVAYDPGLTRLCQTKDTGGKWEIVDTGMLENLIVNSIDVNDQIYLTTDRGIIYQTNGATWERLDFPIEAKNPLQEVSISPDKKLLYATERESTFKYDFAAGDWSAVEAGDISGEITDITMNYAFITISTKDGIWYRSAATQEGSWNKYELRLGKDITIVSLEMVRPALTWTHRFADGGEDDRFLALTDSGEVYSGYLTDGRGLNPIGSISAGTPGYNSLAVNRNSKFAAGSSELLCQQSWTILNWEWWEDRIVKNKPCK